MLFRSFWRQILDDLNSRSSKPAQAGRQIQPLPQAVAGVKRTPMRQPDIWADAGRKFSPEFAQRLFNTLDQAAQLLYMLTQQGLLLGKTPKAGQLFLRNCERLQAVLDACPELRSLARSGASCGKSAETAWTTCWHLLPCWGRILLIGETNSKMARHLLNWQQTTLR